MTVPGPALVHSALRPALVRTGPGTDRTGACPACPVAPADGEVSSLEMTGY